MAPGFRLRVGQEGLLAHEARMQSAGQGLLEPAVAKWALAASERQWKRLGEAQDVLSAGGPRPYFRPAPREGLCRCRLQLFRVR